MKNTHRKFGNLAVIVLAAVPLLITVYLLFLSPKDSSARQTGKQRVFGATYMTMNNPYFQVLDAQIQGLLELNGDVLLTRDAAMDQERQNQEIQELVDAGVSAIFYDAGGVGHLKRGCSDHRHPCGSGDLNTLF